jgi:hypothetical protein
MNDDLIMVSVRIPKTVAERARKLAASQDRTIQAVYSRALRLGMDLEEERGRIACEAIEAAERQRRPARRSGGEQGAGTGEGE